VLVPPPRLLVSTDGRDGGSFVGEEEEGHWSPAPLPGPLRDTYGAGDSFAAGLAYALAEGRSAQDAVDFAAERAALAMTRRGAGG
jgi:ribokinase